jgi:hypothetical protein
LVDGDRDQNAMLGYVLLEFEEFGSVKKVAGIVGAGFDILRKQMA